MAWRGLADLRDLERLDAWFGRILVNACRDRLRRRKVRPLAVDLPEGVEARDRTADIDRDGPGGRRPCAHVRATRAARS
ncbi:MAG: hypothetical protein ACXWXR_08805 [Candidatus Limnocylindrales bacterium]